MIRFFSFLAALLPVLFSVPLRAQPAGALPPDTVRVNVEAAIRRALEISPEVGAVAAQQAFAEARYGLARASRFATEFNLTTAHAAAPGLKIPADFDPGFDLEEPRSALYLDPRVRNDWGDWHPFNRAEVQLLQPLYTWGELTGNLRAARHGVEVEAAEVEGEALSVALRTGELYYGLLLTDELLRLTQRAGDIVEQAKREIRRLLDEGAQDVDDADLFQVQITEQEYLQRVVEVQQQHRTARSALARQLFLPEGTQVVPTESVLTPLPLVLDSLDAYFALALDNRPELDQAAAGVEAREALVDVARSHYFPKLFLGFEANWSYAAGRYRQRNPYIGDPFLGRGIQAGLGVRQQLNFGQTRARVEQAEAELNEVRFQQQAARQLVLFEVEEAYRNFVIARSALAARDSALTLSKEWLQTEYINFDLELGDTENLVRAVQTNLTLEASYFDAVRQYNVAVLRLLDAAGVLVRRAESGTLVD